MAQPNAPLFQQTLLEAVSHSSSPPASILNLEPCREEYLWSSLEDYDYTSKITCPFVIEQGSNKKNTESVMCV